MKTLTLNSSTQSAATSTVEPTESLKSILNCASLSRAQLVFNKILHAENIDIDVTLTFMQALVSIDWVVHGSTNPGKLSLFLLGHSLMHKKSNSSEKVSVVLQLQEVHNNQLCDDSISSLIACNHTQFLYCTDLLHLSSATTTTFAIITRPLSIITMQLEKVKIHTEKHKIVREM